MEVRGRCPKAYRARREDEAQALGRLVKTRSTLMEAGASLMLTRKNRSFAIYVEKSGNQCHPHKIEMVTRQADRTPALPSAWREEDGDWEFAWDVLHGDVRPEEFLV